MRGGISPRGVGEGVSALNGDGDACSRAPAGLGLSVLCICVVFGEATIFPGGPPPPRTPRACASAQQRLRAHTSFMTMTYPITLFSI